MTKDTAYWIDRVTELENECELLREKLEDAQHLIDALKAKLNDKGKGSDSDE